MRSRGCLRALLAIVVVSALVLVGLRLLLDHLSRRPLFDACRAEVAGMSATLTIEEAENAALISALSVRRGMPARAATIALAAAFQESGPRNISYGHLDSLGLFQQRPSQGWGTAAQILDPYYATGRFYDALAQVEGYESMEIADAAQAVQRSAEGSAYAKHEESARALASSLTGHSPAAFSCELREPPQVAKPAGLRTELNKAFGRSASSRTTAKDGRSVLEVRLNDDSATYGWSVAQWAVAYAQRFGIESVSYRDRTWSVHESTEGWQPADSPVPAGSVYIELAPAP